MHVLVVPLVLATLLLGDDEKQYELHLLPKAKKGQQEKMEIDASVSHPCPEGIQSYTFKGTVKRTIKSLDDDGLPKKETLELESASGEDRTDYGNGGAGWSTWQAGNWNETTTRDGKTRNASGLNEPQGMPSALMPILKRDPDQFARLVEPEEKVEAGEDWEVDPKDVLVLVAPTKSKLAGTKSKAKATLESVKKGEARVKLEATLRFTTPDDTENEQKISVEVTIWSQTDGSAPPRKEKVVITTKNAKGEKLVTTINVDRKWAKDDEDEDAKDDEKKDEKKKDKKDEKKKDE
ncbi:MAG TPA: hypothetical protein VFF73_33500 [Planctomycetota bacterium]|nr:hypothetical protein [Planctomycetota bacterium]